MEKLHYKNLNKFRSLPKADLHVHFEGTVTMATCRKLAEKYRMSLDDPVYYQKSLVFKPKASLFSENSFRLNSFSDFIEVYIRISDLIREADDIEQIAEDYAQQAAKENIKHVELYFSPSTHSALGKDLAALFQGLKQAQELLINKFSISSSWIFDIVRNASTDPLETVRWADEARQGGVNVSSIGLAGDEANSPKAETFLGAFNLARELGFATLAHAGESQGAEAIWDVITHLKPQRIGHGLSIINDHQLIAHCLKEQITIEVSPWSNIILGMCLSEEHPIKRMLDAELPIVLCSDDPGIFGKSLSDNFQLAFELGVSEEQIIAMAKRSLS